jgi:hypothetical protein
MLATTIFWRVLARTGRVRGSRFWFLVSGFWLVVIPPEVESKLQLLGINARCRVLLTLKNSPERINGVSKNAYMQNKKIHACILFQYKREAPMEPRFNLLFFATDAWLIRSLGLLRKFQIHQIEKPPIGG